MTASNRHFARRTVARPSARGAAARLFAALLLAGLTLAPAALLPVHAQDAADGEATTIHDLTWRERTDRPVVAFTRGPAGLLLTPAEHAEYARLTDRVERLKFIERFWFDVAINCLPGENPVRDEFWERAELAHERYADAGMPGWLTDPGRVILLVGEPDAERDATIRIGGASRPAQTWTWNDPGDGPASVVFLKDPLGWRMVAVDSDVSADPIVLSYSDIPSLDQVTRRFATAFREKGCVLTPEQLAERKSLAWRKTLFDATGRLMAGETAASDGSLAPEWLFFPARDGATFTTVSFALDARPPEGSRLVVMLRDEQSADPEEGGAYVIGAGDAAFEYRENGGKVIARAARSLPPGRYKVAAGVIDAQDRIRVGYAGSQIVARVTDESLRLTSVLLASELEKADADAPGPFTLGGYAFTPALDNVFKAGDTFYMLFQAVGATANASGQADVTVKYTLHGKHPQRGWVAIGAPQTETSPGGVRVREVPIPPSYPPTDYKWEIEVKDNATGQSVSKEVRFTVVRS